MKYTSISNGSCKKYVTFLHNSNILVIVDVYVEKLSTCHVGGSMVL